MELNRFIIESYAGHFWLACRPAPLYAVTLADLAFYQKSFTAENGASMVYRENREPGGMRENHSHNRKSGIE